MILGGSPVDGEQKRGGRWTNGQRPHFLEGFPTRSWDPKVNPATPQWPVLLWLRHTSTLPSQDEDGFFVYRHSNRKLRAGEPPHARKHGELIGLYTATYNYILALAGLGRQAGSTISELCSRCPLSAYKSRKVFSANSNHICGYTISWKLQWSS
jgi:hypothetical protein